MSNRSLALFKKYVLCESICITGSGKGKIILVEKIRTVIASGGLERGEGFTGTPMKELSGVWVMFWFSREVWVVLIPDSPNYIVKFCAFQCM